MYTCLVNFCRMLTPGKVHRSCSIIIHGVYNSCFLQKNFSQMSNICFSDYGKCLLWQKMWRVGCKASLLVVPSSAAGCTCQQPGCTWILSVDIVSYCEDDHAEFSRALWIVIIRKFLYITLFMWSWWQVKSNTRSLIASKLLSATRCCCTETKHYFPLEPLKSSDSLIISVNAIKDGLCCLNYFSTRIFGSLFYPGGSSGVNL